MKPRTRSRLKFKKLPAMATPVVFALYMAAIMAFLMCSVIVGVDHGVSATLPAEVLRAYAFAMPIAFVCVLVVRPIVLRLVRWTVHTPSPR